MRILCGKSAALGQSKLWQNRDKLVEATCFVQVGGMFQTKSSFPECRMEIVLPAPEGTSGEYTEGIRGSGAVFRLLVP